MQTQQLINRLPEVIKCIIFDHVSYDLNYLVELQSDKFIGNPIILYYKIIIEFYHINKLTKFKTPLHFIELYCNRFLPSQEILNKLQIFSFICDDILPNLPCIKNLYVQGNFTEIPNFMKLQKLHCCYSPNLTKIPLIVELLELNCSNCRNLTEIPIIVGLLELNCSRCPNLIEIPNIKGLEKLDCYKCPKLTKIPHIEGLLELDCSWCNDYLTKIPNIVGINKIRLF